MSWPLVLKPLMAVLTSGMSTKSATMEATSTRTTSEASTLCCRWPVCLCTAPCLLSCQSATRAAEMSRFMTNFWYSSEKVRQMAKSTTATALP